MRLKDKTAIITGAASGLGRATAIRLAADGAKIVLVDMDDAKGKATEQEIRASGGQAYFIQTDIRVCRQVEQMVRRALEYFPGTLDILVNAAGVLRLGYVVDCSEEDYDLTMDVNLKGTYLCCKAVLPTMIRQGSGAIVNVSSSAALRPSADYPLYTASKFAVEGLTRALAAEVNKDHISVMAIRPGVIDTPLGRQGIVERKGRQPTQEELSHMLLPEEVAGMIAHMVDPEFARATSAVIDAIVP